MIRTATAFDLDAERAPDVNTGAWINGSKVAAIGVKVRKWVSLHGIALNCEDELSSFETINPCGITTHGVTSLSRECGRPVKVEHARPVVRGAFEEVFGLELQDVDVLELLAQDDA